jgi:hypothetical protein
MSFSITHADGLDQFEQCKNRVVGNVLGISGVILREPES